MHLESTPETTLVPHLIMIACESIVGRGRVGEWKCDACGSCGVGGGSGFESCKLYNLFFARSVVCAFPCPPSYWRMRSGAWPFCVLEAITIRSEECLKVLLHQ